MGLGTSFLIWAVSILVFTVVIPLVVQSRSHGPFADHAFPRWRWLEFIATMTACAFVCGLIAVFAVGVFDDHSVVSVVAYTAALAFGTGFITWARTGGLFAYVPNRDDWAGYVDQRTKELKK